MAYAYFPATVQVESFNHNGTVFVKAQNLDEAQNKLATIVTPKDTDFLDFFANISFAVENKTDNFLFGDPADSFDEIIAQYSMALND